MLKLEEQIKKSEERSEQMRRSNVLKEQKEESRKRKNRTSRQIAIGRLVEKIIAAIQKDEEIQKLLIEITTQNDTNILDI